MNSIWASLVVFRTLNVAIAWYLSIFHHSDGNLQLKRNIAQCIKKIVVCCMCVCVYFFGISFISFILIQFLVNTRMIYNIHLWIGNWDAIDIMFYVCFVVIVFFFAYDIQQKKLNNITSIAIQFVYLHHSMYFGMECVLEILW